MSHGCPRRKHLLQIAICKFQNSNLHFAICDVFCFDTEEEVVIIESNYNRGNSGQLIAAVNLKSGEVRRGEGEDVQRAIANSNLWVQ
jgi:hypothetical protein